MLELIAILKETSENIQRRPNTIPLQEGQALST